MPRDAGWFQRDDADLLARADDNPDGFFDRADVRRLHDRLLDEPDFSWDRPPPTEVLDSSLSANTDVISATVPMALDTAASSSLRPGPRR